MPQTFQLITADTRGVDGGRDPFTLQTRHLAHAVNLTFDQGGAQSRPGFIFQSLGVAGEYQGSATYSPSLGLHFQPFAKDNTFLVLAVGGCLYTVASTYTGMGSVAAPLELPMKDYKCGEIKQRRIKGDVWVFQSENWLVVQNQAYNTLWWNGLDPVVASPGMTSEENQGTNHSGETFDFSKHKNFLINSAGLGVYAHGRTHQQGERALYVSDPVGFRGALMTDDVLLMEQQSKPFCGGPLTVPSRLGRLVALVQTPQMGTANGEGPVVAYYESGIVKFRTDEFPRESKFTAKGERVQNGWDTKRMVDHHTNGVSAVGRYAVCPVFRDQFFRSFHGVHVLSQLAGVEYIKDEPVNTISSPVKPVLEQDDADYLFGCSAGYWISGNRWFVTTGLHSNDYSSSAVGTGFVSYNKSWTVTEDQTPIPAWDGVWVPDMEVSGIHRFTHAGLRQDRGPYGFICSDNDGRLYFAAINETVNSDFRDGSSIPVQWAFETGKYDFGNRSETKKLMSGRFEGVYDSKRAKIKVYVRTDTHPEWELWTQFWPCTEAHPKTGEEILQAETLGQPPDELQNSTWFQFRVEGTGFTRICAFEVEISKGSVKVGKEVTIRLTKARKEDLLSPAL